MTSPCHNDNTVRDQVVDENRGFFSENGSRRQCRVKSPLVIPLLQCLADLSRHLNRFSRAVESVDWNAKMLIAMLAYHIELDLSFLPEPTTTDEREMVSEKGARRFDRFEQWLVRHLVDPDNLYSRLQRSAVPAAEDFAREPG